MRKIANAILLLTSVFILFSGKAETQRLYPAKGENGCWGYIDEQGGWVIGPVYDGASEFRGKYGVVSRSGLKTVINRQGQTVAKLPENCYCDNGYDGFYYGGRDTGIILVYDTSTADTEEEEETEPEGISYRIPTEGFFDIQSGFFSGIKWCSVYPRCSADSRLIAVKDENGLTGYADRTTGDMVIPFLYFGSDPGSFSGGVAAVSFEDGDGNAAGFFLIDESGNRIELPDGFKVSIYTNAADGRIRVNKDGLYGFADTQGRIVIPPRYLSAEDFANGWAKVRFPEGDWGRIDRDGNVLVRGIEADGKGPVFDKNGLFVTGQEGAFTLHGPDGQTLFSLSLENLVSLSTPDENGVCSYAVDPSGKSNERKERRFGKVGADGRILCEAKYIYRESQQSIESDCGLIPAGTGNGKWGYIDAWGKPVIDFIYDEAYGFDGKLARVVLYDGNGSNEYTVALIDPTGSPVRSWKESR